MNTAKSRLRPWRWGLAFAVGAALQGCPVYDDYCNRRSDCAPGFQCNGYTGKCELLASEPGPRCAAPDDCGPGETCGQLGECLPGSCVFHGCVSGYACTVVDSLHTCAPGGGGPVATDAGSPDASASGDGVSTDAGLADASSDAAAPADAAADSGS